MGPHRVSSAANRLKIYASWVLPINNLKEPPPRTACHFGKQRKSPQPGQNTDENSLKQALTLCECPKFPFGEQEIRRREGFRPRRCGDERRLRAEPGAADQASGSSARGSSSSPPRPQQQPELYRAVMESFRAGSRGLPLRASTYESTAATSSELRRRLGILAYWYFSKRATAIGSPSASILS